MLERSNDFNVWAAGHEERYWERGQSRKEIGDKVEELSLVLFVEFVQTVDDDDDVAFVFDSVAGVEEGADDKFVHLLLERGLKKQRCFGKRFLDEGKENLENLAELIREGGRKVFEGVASGVALPNEE